MQLLGNGLNVENTRTGTCVKKVYESSFHGEQPNVVPLSRSMTSPDVPNSTERHKIQHKTKKPTVSENMIIDPVAW